MNINNHLNETNVAISLRVSITNHLKLVRIYLRNPVYIISPGAPLSFFMDFRVQGCFSVEFFPFK